MGNGKKPFQFGPRTPEQKQRHHLNGQANQTQEPPMSPEQQLRMRALMRMDILPPYQAMTPHEMVFVENGKETVKSFKGLTKREYFVGKFAAACVEKDGLPLRDEEMASIVRRSVNMSEIMLQTLSALRGKDIEEIMKQIQMEDAMAVSMDAAAERQDAETPSEN